MEREVQHHDLRRLRHLVVGWINSGGSSTFVHFLKCLFLIALSLCVINYTFLGLCLSNGQLPKKLLEQTWLLMSETDRKGHALIAIFAAAVCVGALVRKLKEAARSAPQRKEEVNTISATIQHV